MAMIKFTESRLTETGKKGVLTPDSDGYYEMIIGGLNVYNSAGEYYVYEGAKLLFEQSSSFMRRIKTGCLKGELGHPKRLPGMSMDDYLTRIMTIEETNVMCHFSDIYLDTEFGKKHPEYKNPNLVAIIGKFKPAGPHANVLKSALENPKEEVCFSIRALTKDTYRNGRNERTLVQVVTFDACVAEPGIMIARKWHSPGLESHNETPVTISQIQRLAEISNNEIAIESSAALANETLKLVDIKLSTIKPPSFAKW